MKAYKLCIFDVDGTLVSTKSGATFRKSADDWQWLPGRLDKIHSLVGSGVSVAFATNQGGVAFGYMDARAILAELARMAVEARVHPDRVHACFTHPKASIEFFRCDDQSRKPGPGMLLEAMEDAPVDPDETLMVGDRPEDQGAALAAQCDFMWADEYFT